MKKRALAVWIFVVVAVTLLAGCGAAGGGGTNVSVNDVGNVEGTVTDATTGALVSGVTVQVGDKTATTGTNGVYSITDLAVGSRTATATKTGYQNYNGTVTVTKGTTVTHNIQMTLTGAGDTTPPTVSSTSPANNATGIAINSAIIATFSEAMDVSTITPTTFTLKQGATPVSGTVTYSGTTATFTPSSNLAYSTTYTATISTGVKDAAGNAIAAAYIWTFTTGAASASSGSLDSTFGIGGKVTTDIGSGWDTATALAFQSDGKIVAAGYAVNGSNYDFAIVRYNTDGTFDTSFGTAGKVTTDIGSGWDTAMALGIQSDGKIVAAGYANNGSNNDFAVVRYNTDGSLDTTFGTGGRVTTSIGSGNDMARALGIQSDGKIVVAGHFDNSSNDDFAIVRYNTDGSLDTTFGTGGKATTAIGAGGDGATALGIQSDGKIVAAGHSWNGSNYDFAIVRYNTDGSLDTSFGSGGKATADIGSSSDTAHALGIQSDGKIVTAGGSDNGSNSDFALVRYNTDGSLDTSFGTSGKVTTAIGSSSDTAHALGIQSDGKIVVAGDSRDSNNLSNYDFAIVRYNAAGTLDSTFGTGGKVTTAIGSGADLAYALGIQSDGKIVASGVSSDFFALVRYIP